MLRSTSLRVLDARDIDAVLALLARDPVASVYVGARVAVAGLDPWRLGGEMWGHVVDGRLDAVCYAGANLIPVLAGPDAVAAFAERGRRQGRRCSLVCGRAESVGPLWELLRPSWGAARDVRHDQPLLAIAGSPAIAPDPLVRRVTMDELDILLPACIAMFTEEVGVSPLAGDGGALYRARVAELVAAGRAYARIEHGAVVFKAEIGAATSAVCQVQGVWVTPERRGQGLSGPGMAAVVELARREVAPLVSLYVNDFNVAARAAYRRVGFEDCGTFMSVLF